MFCIKKKQIIFARKIHEKVLSHQNCLRNINVEKCIQISLILLSRKSIKAVQLSYWRLYGEQGPICGSPQIGPCSP